MKTKNKLCLCLHGELYVIDLDDVMCFEADDHYTHVFSSRGNNFMVPFTLGRIEEMIKNRHSENVNLTRLGRKYIINLNSIYHVNVVRQQVSLADNHGKAMTLSLSKAVLRSLMEILRTNDEIDVDEISAEG